MHPTHRHDKLVEGGMDKLFRALHTRNNREVALKVVRAHLLAKPTARGRYEREVQAALALSHPNIVAVARAGSTDGQYFLEMEFVDGLDLTQMVQRYGIFSVAEACEYARQAALGLHHAHELGFVHRLMAKKPDQRFATAFELAEVLKPLCILSSRPVSDPPTGESVVGTAETTPESAVADGRLPEVRPTRNPHRKVNARRRLVTW